MRLFLCREGKGPMQRTINILHFESESIFVCLGIEILIGSDYKCWERAVVNTLIINSVFVEVSRNHNIETLILATL